MAYVGPVEYQGKVSYRGEDWFQELMKPGRDSVITEIYPGFRNQPHFTIAVRRGDGASAWILRSALSPERLSDYLKTLEGANEVHAAIVNGKWHSSGHPPWGRRASSPVPFFSPAHTGEGLRPC